MLLLEIYTLECFPRGRFTFVSIIHVVIGNIYIRMLAARPFYICVYISNNNMDYRHKCKTAARQTSQCEAQPCYNHSWLKNQSSSGITTLLKTVIKLY